MRRNLRAQELYHNPDSPHRSDDRNYPCTSIRPNFVGMILTVGCNTVYHSIQQEPTFRSTSEASLSAAPSGATNRIYSAPHPMPNQTSWSRMQVERGPEAHKEEENGCHPRNAHGIRLRPTSDLRASLFTLPHIWRRIYSPYIALQRICIARYSNLAFSMPFSQSASTWSVLSVLCG